MKDATIHNNPALLTKYFSIYLIFKEK